MVRYLCTRFGNGTKVVDQVSLGHADTSIADGEHLLLFIRDDANVEVPFRIEDTGLS